MQFAWLRKNRANDVSDKQTGTQPLALIRIAYNAVFWIFLVPFIVGAIDYSLGFIAFTIVILVRLIVNLYVNNLVEFTPEQYERFPLRS
ncbi:MAG: hypothetical protein PVH18_12865 [Chloroflexota bacterium]|jgi:membrane protein YdbS with pleckstrin-like domain